MLRRNKRNPKLQTSNTGKQDPDLLAPRKEGKGSRLAASDVGGPKSRWAVPREDDASPKCPMPKREIEDSTLEELLSEGSNPI